MSYPTTIEEALATLPASDKSFTIPHIPIDPATGHRRLLVKNSKRPTSTSSSTSKRPPLQEWQPQPTHILTNANNHNRGLTRISKVKEAIQIAGRDPGFKQSLKFTSSLPLPFLEQNGYHDEDLTIEITGQQESISEEETGGAGLTASDLEFDLASTGNDSDDGEGAGMTANFLEDSMDDDSNPSPPPSTSKAAARPSKRQRIDSSNTETSDSLPRDFLDLLKSEVPGGRTKVSPGDFARVWKLSGRKMGNDMVLAQNEYFGTADKDTSKVATNKKAKGKTRR
ncbi:hypothetical protein ABW21_db0201121 [Orbilia brochopaga]|nr:hypothetical protein ABW21_db0201121 [Drechslerella brochopaga]